MSRRYKRYSSRRSSNGGNPLGLLVLLACVFFFQYWKLILLILVIAAAGLYLWRYLKQRDQAELPSVGAAPVLPGEAAPSVRDGETPTYSSKASLMTDCEKKFFDAIKKIVGPDYIIQPQINLASIINKESHSKYRNELFRNIDFGILDQNYKLLVLIEINDATHTERSRKERDQKVQAICAEAGIPLITFWTKYGLNESYIRERLAAHIPLKNDAMQTAEHPASES